MSTFRSHHSFIPRPMTPASGRAAVLVVLVLLCSLAPAVAQTPAPPRAQKGGRLVVNVTDTLGGVLPGVTVTVTGPLPGIGNVAAITGEQGDAVIEDQAPGRYRLDVELPGFTPVAVELRIAAGQTTTQAVAMELGTFADQVVVSQTATDRQLNDNFTETMTEADVEQLPEDADEMTALLTQLAGPDADIRVNGFEGGELPPKEQIQAVRIRQDPYAPDSHGAGRPRVEIITKPGTTVWRHNVNLGLRDQSLDARNAFAPERAPGQTRRLRWSLSGPIVKGRTSLALNIGTRSAFDAQTILATRPDGLFTGVVNQENQRFSAEVRVEHALTAAHTLRVEYQRHTSESDNLGVGQFDLPERAYASEWSRHVARISDIGTFGKKAFNELRIEYIHETDTRQAATGGLTVNVQNAFVSGSAQLSGGARNQEVEIGDDLELVLSERHKVRIGFEGELGWSRNDRADNADGTFTFASLEDYAAGRPLQFVQRIGDPLVNYSRYELGWYVHDELRLRDNLQLGLGLRHEMQSYVDGWRNFGPRASLSWTPFAHGKTTVRGGIGVFYDWFDTSTYEQTLRVDGFHQRDLIVPDPFDLWEQLGGETTTIDDVGASVDGMDGVGGVGGVGGGSLPPPSVIRAANGLDLQSTRRASVGVEQNLTTALQVRANVFEESTWNRLRSLNVNAPVDGIVPDPQFERITEIRSIGEATERGFDVSLRARSDVRRMFGFVRYRYARELNDADGPLSLPADSYDLAAEWGSATWDIRHRIFAYYRARLPLGIGLGLGTEISSGSPYTIRTGFDDNGDTVTNDRPAGVGRNSARTEWQQSSDLRLSWRIDNVAEHDGRGGSRSVTGAAPASAPAAGAPSAGAPSAGARPASGVPAASPRASLQPTAGQPTTTGMPELTETPRGVEVYAQISNLFNTVNYNRYASVMSSSLFGQPTTARAARRMELGLRVFF